MAYRALLFMALLALWAPPAAGAAPADAFRHDALLAAQGRAESIPDRFLRTWARYAVAGEWSQSDPARAAELADRLESWTAKRDLLSEVMFAWGQADPPAAARWGLAFKERTHGTLAQRNTALQYAVVGMVRKDPKLADELIWEHLEEEQWGNKPRTTPMQAACELAAVDPRAALLMADKITNHEQCRVYALRGVLREWARQDPAAARAALAGRKEADFQRTFSRDLVEGWAAKDPQAALAYARTIEDRSAKIMALALIARRMARSNPKAAAELCTVFATLDVGKWDEQMPRLGKIVAEVGRAYAAADRQAAAAWAEALPAGQGGCRANGIDGVAAGWAETDPDGALAFYAGPKESKARPDRKQAPRGTGAAYPAIARQVAKRDPREAARLVAATDSLVLKSHILHEVAVELMARDPVAAADLVEHWGGVVDYYGYRGAAAAAVAAVWGQASPKASAAWSAKLTPERDRAAALRAAARAWATAAPAAALAWAQALRDPQDAVHALLGVAAAARPASPAPSRTATTSQ
ncbi:MAG: hypothetical protein ABSG86_00375 [Thermoguttaceae bacterium]